MTIVAVIAVIIAVWIGIAIVLALLIGRAVRLADARQAELMSIRPRRGVQVARAR